MVKAESQVQQTITEALGESRKDMEILKDKLISNEDYYYL